ncbi:MAG: O-antigen ligase family protein [Saprospiraceae bacterium]|nr:O-antigen ligase family protein [Saprospiraceae bacterium]
MSESKTYNKKSKKHEKWHRLLFTYTLLMAFPSLMFLGQNLSVLIFIVMIFFLLQNIRSQLISFCKPLQWLALLFAFGAILSVSSIPYEAAHNALERALSVLPNYLYWSVLIIIMITHRRLLDLDVIYKAVFWGIIATLAYYLVFQSFLRPLPIFNRLSANAFSFLLICYSPIAIYYLSQNKSRLWATFFLALLVLILLITGRRAGMVLVFLGGIAVLYADHINWKRILLAAAIIPIAIMLLFTRSVEALVLQSSERIHQMIYETEKIQKEDRSYLTRIAMINKGKAIFEKYPYTGIGLNNFTNYSADFDKSFEGAEFVVNKVGIQEASAHNSYVAILAEGGLFLLVPLLLILVYNIIYFLFNFNRLSPYLPVYVGLMGMSVHLYFISAIVNVFAWYLIGLACAITSLPKRR